MRKAKIILTKSQSIMEYLIVLAAIMVGIIASTIGLRAGLQNSLDINQNITEANVKSTEPTQRVKNETYYAASHEYFNSTWDDNLDQRNESAAFDANQY